MNGPSAGLDARAPGASVLIARFLAFGDVLLTLPLAKALSVSPAVRDVHVVTLRRYADLLIRSPYLGRVFAFDPALGSGADDLDNIEYDVLVDLHTRAAPLPPAIEALLDRIGARQRIGYANPWEPSGNGKLPTRRWDEHAVEYYARAANGLIEGSVGSHVIDIAEPDIAAAASLLPARSVCIAPGARFPFKRWPEECYAALIERLDRHGIQTVLVGHPSDGTIIDRIRAATGAAAIVLGDDYRLAAVLRAGGVVVANNSGMAHLAQAAGARVVCIHSHTLPVMWRPWGAGHVNITGDPGPCRCPDLTEFETPVPCGRSIDPAVVTETVLGLLAGGSAG